MSDIVAVFGSPRRKGNTAALLNAAVAGARDAGASVEEIVLRDLKWSPCLEIYRCAKDGECAIRDDFQNVRDRILAARGLMLATPIFFYAVSAQTKAFMDRFQSLWIKKYWIEKTPFGKRPLPRKGLLIAAGATHGKRLFDGTLLTVRNFFDVLDMELWKSLLYRGLDFEGDAQKHPEYLAEARETGKTLAGIL